MKKRILFGMLALLMSFGTLAKDPQAQPNELKTLQQQVQKIIKKNRHKIPMEEDFIARISLVINDKNELVVVDTDCDDARINSYIKNSLNYKKVTTPLSGEYSRYIIPVRFQKGNFLLTR